LPDILSKNSLLQNNISPKYLIFAAFFMYFKKAVMKKIFLLSLIASLFASCSSGPKFELDVNIRNNRLLIDKKLVVNQLINGSVIYADTIKIRKEKFLLELPYFGPALMKITIPGSNLKEIVMVAEEGKIQLNIDGVKPDFSGTPLNDRTQTFYNANDSVSLLFENLKKEYNIYSNTTQITAQMMEEYSQKRNQLLNENTDRIISFIRENVDNPIGEFYFAIHYIMFPLEQKLELNSFATDKLKKEFNIK